MSTLHYVTGSCQQHWKDFYGSGNSTPLSSPIHKIFFFLPTAKQDCSYLNGLHWRTLTPCVENGYIHTQIQEHFGRVLNNSPLQYPKIYFFVNYQPLQGSSVIYLSSVTRLFILFFVLNGNRLFILSATFWEALDNPLISIPIPRNTWITWTSTQVVAWKMQAVR